MRIEISGSVGQSEKVEFRKRDLPVEPFTLFATWYEEAKAANMFQYDAVNLATATKAGRPSNRYVVMRGFDERGFCFYTSYESRKGEELAENPFAAMSFWWGPMGRQVRIEGTVVKLTDAESDAYYHSRPRESRLGAWASEQSQPLVSREVLVEEYEGFTAKYEGTDPPRPPFWGGYRLIPDFVEFWQEGARRLHNRFCYRRQEVGGWEIERLAP